jgi:predicted kinase
MMSMTYEEALTLKVIEAVREAVQNLETGKFTLINTETNEPGNIYHLQNLAEQLDAALKNNH